MRAHEHGKIPILCSHVLSFLQF